VKRWPNHPFALDQSVIIAFDGDVTGDAGERAVRYVIAGGFGARNNFREGN
jgi:hypothetical protein